MKENELFITDYDTNLRIASVIKQEKNGNLSLIKYRNPKYLRMIPAIDDVLPNINDIKEKDWYISCISINPDFLSTLEVWEVIVHDILINESATYRDLYMLGYYNICRSLILRGNILEIRIGEAEKYFVNTVLSLIDDKEDIQKLHIIIDGLIAGYDIVTTAVLSNANISIPEYKYLAYNTPELNEVLRLCCIINLTYQYTAPLEITKRVLLYYINDDYTDIISINDLKCIKDEKLQSNYLYLVDKLYKKKHIYQLINTAIQNIDYDNIIYQSPYGDLIIKASSKETALQFTTNKLLRFSQLTRYPMEVLIRTSELSAKTSDLKYKKCGVIFEGNISNGDIISMYCGKELDSETNSFIENNICAFLQKGRN